MKQPKITRELLIETLKKNQEIAQIFFEIETSVLSILNLKDFFEKLLTELQDKLKLPYVWVSIFKNSKVDVMIHTLELSDKMSSYMNIIDNVTFNHLIGERKDPIIISGTLGAFGAMVPEAFRYQIGSLVIAPLILDGKIIGSLNHADPSELRFQPDMDTTLLKQLATIVSICLSNVMAHEMLNQLASRDPLTGLLNRRVMEQALHREFERASRYRTPLSVVFIDIDDFKIVNDTYGHGVGDDILKHVADNLTRLSRKSDIVARFAGDEFVIILPNTNFQDARDFAKRIEAFFSNNHMKIEDGKAIPAALSVGVSSFDEELTGDHISLLQKADKMLYESKKQKTG